MSFEKIKNIIAVASGKGGVGKSTTAVNLALALKASQKTVGLLDADIYGPNIPQMLGQKTNEGLSRNDEKKIIPVLAKGLPTMSIGYLLEEQSPAIWRGPMASTAVQQLLRETDWGSLDFLVVDLPPGTGDIPLSLAQKLPIQGALIVTTPQPVALLDVHKAIGMFQKVHIPLLGVIENMASYQCRQCGHQEPLFGKGGGKELSKQYNLPDWGIIPLDIRIREHSDQGNPFVDTFPEHEITQKYYQIAQHLIASTLRSKTRSFPRISIEEE